MANSNNSKEPNTAPHPDRWYNLTLGSSFKDHQPSSKFCSLRYEFKPASIDKSQPGSLHKNKDNRVTVDFQNNQHGKPKVSFEGSSEDYKDNDAVLLFDGETFRLERLHRAVKRLRHVRLPGESASAAATPSVGLVAEASSPPVGKAPKFHSLNKSVPQSMPVEVERIEIGDFKGSADAKAKNDKVVDCPPPAHPNHIPTSSSSPDLKNDDDLEEQLDILNDDDDDEDCAAAYMSRENGVEKEQLHVGIDINLAHDTDDDDEIADIDGSGDEADKVHNAEEVSRAQANNNNNNNTEREEQTSSSSRSGSDSSGGSGSGSGSSSSSSSDSSDDGDSISSI